MIQPREADSVFGPPTAASVYPSPRLRMTTFQEPAWIVMSSGVGRERLWVISPAALIASVAIAVAVIEGRPRREEAIGRPLRSPITIACTP